MLQTFGSCSIKGALEWLQSEDLVWFTYQPVRVLLLLVFAAFLALGQHKLFYSQVIYSVVSLFSETVDSTSLHLLGREGGSKAPRYSTYQC